MVPPASSQAVLLAAFVVLHAAPSHTGTRQAEPLGGQSISASSQTMPLDDESDEDEGEPLEPDDVGLLEVDDPDAPSPPSPSPSPAPADLPEPLGSPPSPPLPLGPDAEGPEPAEGSSIEPLDAQPATRHAATAHARPSVAAWVVVDGERKIMGPGPIVSRKEPTRQLALSRSDAR